ncbi:M23 family metallopeptidase [Pedobacter sp. SL55]|uniref:M23 family metallopeptidase n=1 Tax=Pedobacter sp. SL55 TaxID=2995161 RepID=UPI002D1E3BB1|nr:M23 family metallopeptidase [Pedobacter sp. SL55]
MSKRKDKTTVIFLDQNQNYNQPFQIKTYYIRHWKKFAMLLLAFVCLLLGVIMHLVKTKAQMQRANKDLAMLLEKQKSEAVLLDTATIKKHYLSIDDKLKTINKYLKARGLKPMPKSQGGELDAELGSTEEIGSFYEEYLKRMIRLVGFTPMGYPHKGRISSNFGHRANPFTGESIERHKGLDIKGNHGEVVKTTANGKVKFANRKGGYGNVVIIEHGNGFETYYGHLSKISVKQGQKVAAGDIIGRIGSTGRSTGPHLHYEVHRNGKIVNPKSYLTIE